MIDFEKYEKQHLLNIAKVEGRLSTEYKKFYAKLIKIIEQGYTERVIMRMVDKEVKKLEKSLNTTTNQGITNAISQSVSKNTAIVSVFKYKPDFDLTRVKADLSPKIWNLAENLIDPIKNALRSGMSAADLAKTIVGDINTTAKGQGVYKEPIKNTMRVARTEINRTYILNDALTYNKLDFVLGKEIRLSNSPKKKARCWMCRGLVGKYPKDFIWDGFHPNCLCTQIPILMTLEQFKLWEDGKLDKIPYVEMGQDKVDWVKENSYRWANWKDQPRWLVNF